MPVYTDQLGRKIEIKEFPAKIVSLVPSQTELLSDLGLDDEVTGITKFCVHPEHWFRTKTRIGGTKQLHIETIKALKPDLIIANKEENVQSQVEELAKDFPVWISDVNNLENAIDMICKIGAITGKETIAGKIASTIKTNFQEIDYNRNSLGLKCCYLIWQEPYMAAGRDTFIHDMIFHAGYRNLFEDKNRYPEITLEDIKERSPDIIFLSSEPYPFKQKHVNEFAKLMPGIKVLLTDGELFSWYGSRLIKSPAYFKQLEIQALSVF